MTVAITSDQLIRKLDTAVLHADNSQPNRARKRVSEFLKATGKFQKLTNSNYDQIFLRHKMINNPQLVDSYLKVLHIFLNAKGKHPRRNVLAMDLVIYFTNIKNPLKSLEARKNSGKVINLSRSKERKSAKNLTEEWEKNLMEGWVFIYSSSRDEIPTQKT